MYVASYVANASQMLVRTASAGVVVAASNTTPTRPWAIPPTSKPITTIPRGTRAKCIHLSNLACHHLATR
jgi:hypothetical protein